MVTVRTRFAPSPSGLLHIGGARTALFSWLYAQKHQGDFFLRIEDTDADRSTQVSVNAIVEGMRWLHLNWHGAIVHQSKQLPRYRETIQLLLKQDRAYHCYCLPEELQQMREQQQQQGIRPHYDGRCRRRQLPPPKGVQPTVRLRTPGKGSVVFDDIIHGTIRTEVKQLDDFIIARSDSSPTYNFTVVVDDLDMQISHVIRGDDHISNTPKQLVVYASLGSDPPVFAHIPMITDAQHKRLSKRRGEAGIEYYRKQGFVADAVVNYLLRLGWSHGDKEFFHIDEAIKWFDLCDVHKSAAVFDTKKLRSINSHFMSKTPTTEYLQEWKALLVEYGYDSDETGDSTVGKELSKIARWYTALAPRYDTLREMAEGARFLFASDLACNREIVKKFITDQFPHWLRVVVDNTSNLNCWSEGNILPILDRVRARFGLSMKEFGPGLRYLLTADSSSPGLATTMGLIGRSLCRQRLEAGIRLVEDLLQQQRRSLRQE